MTEPAKVCGLLCWWNESPLWLAATVASLAGVVDHLVAVDGAYALFPAGKPRSPVKQHEAIAEAASAARIGLTLHAPPERWAGNEVEKRNASVTLASVVADDGWWLLGIDGDEVVTHVSESFRYLLAASPSLVAVHGQVDRLDPHADELVAANARRNLWQKVSCQPRRALYRWSPSLRYEQAHYVITVEDSQGARIFLRGRDDIHELAPAEDLTHELVIEHRNRLRDRERAEQARHYYRLRDELGIERLAEHVVAAV